MSLARLWCWLHHFLLPILVWWWFQFCRLEGGSFGLSEARTLGSDARRPGASIFSPPMLVIAVDLVVAKSGSCLQMPGPAGACLGRGSGLAVYMKLDDNLCLFPSPSLSHTHPPPPHSTQASGGSIQSWFQNVQAAQIELIHGSSDDEAKCFPWFESSRKARKLRNTGRTIIM